TQPTDGELLRQYVQTRDEAAFAGVVRRYVNLVYATALRVAYGDAALAEDVTQATFTELARKAGELTDRATLAGWLHTTARFTALRNVRDELRRRAREQEAHAMNDSTDSAPMEISWEQLRPVLDEAIGELDDADRDAVLLRYFQDKSHREVGAVLGLNENSARMRVERAVDKLRGQFSRRGVTTTGALLATMLGARGASVAAPVELAGSVAGKSLADVSEARYPGVRVKSAGVLGKPSRLLVVAVVVLVVGIMVYTQYFQASSIPDVSQPKKQIASGQPETLKLPIVAPGNTTAQNGGPHFTNELGEIHFARSNMSPHEFTLSSGLIFSIQSDLVNPDGTIDIDYGAYETSPGRVGFAKAAGNFPLELNSEYSINIKSGTAINVTLATGEVVKFTPIADAPEVNKLGVVTLAPGFPQVFTLISGKILVITLTGNPDADDGHISEEVFQSEQDYIANRSDGAGGGTPPNEGSEQRFDVGGLTTDPDEIVTYMPKYSN
ncbi:MAG TPA: sigma-70 family RNA polymerase sigma factor, partial [Opitutales bacterium]|nr:sigma-70 family RNA polymerase sigma factor [Opitutales bacterium]